MKEELKKAVRIPRGISLVIIVIMSIYVIGALKMMSNLQFTLFLYTFCIFLPFVVPYFIGLKNVRFTGVILILEGILISILSIIFFNAGNLWHDYSIMLFPVYFFCFLFVILGIWMIAIVRKFSKKLSQTDIG